MSGQVMTFDAAGVPGAGPFATPEQARMYHLLNAICEALGLPEDVTGLTLTCKVGMPQSELIVERHVLDKDDIRKIVTVIEKYELAPRKVVHRDGIVKDVPSP